MKGMHTVERHSPVPVMMAEGHFEVWYSHEIAVGVDITMEDVDRTREGLTGRKSKKPWREMNSMKKVCVRA